MKVVAGHLPAESSPYDVLASFTLQQDYGVHIGSVIHAPLYASSQFPALASGANVSPIGAKRLPCMSSESVRPKWNFPQGRHPNTTSSTPAFARAVNKRIVLASVYLVRLRHETSSRPRFAAAAGSLHLVYVSDQATAAAAVAASIHPQAVGWWVLAVLAGLVGLAIIGQALGRQSVVESEEYPSLVALGLPRRHLVVLGMARNLMWLSSAQPVPSSSPLHSPPSHRSARHASPSLRPDLPSIRWFSCSDASNGGGGPDPGYLAGSPASRRSRRRPGIRRPTLAHRRKGGRHGVPLSAVIGVRHALERGRGAASVPVDPHCSDRRWRSWPCVPRSYSPTA